MVPLRIGHPELAARPLLDVAALLLADEHDGAAVELPEAGDHRAVVAEPPVAVQLEPVVEQPLDVIERVRTILVPRELDRAPDLVVGRLLSDPVELPLQAVELPGELRPAEQRHVAEPAQPLAETQLVLTRRH